MTLTLESVSYRYAGAARTSLNEVSLELADGEVVGVVGASEAGKTTICLVASGLAPRSIGGTLTGRVLIDGKPIADADAGDDVSGGRLTVSQQRLYRLVALPKVEDRTLTIQLAPGTTAYAFTFG